MPRKSCNPCPPPPPTPDNCYAECVKCCVEKCKTICCERKYFRLAHRLLDNGLFVDTANYVRNEVHQIRTNSQFFNIVNYWSAPNGSTPPPTDVDSPTDIIYVNNQPNNLISLRSLGFAHVNVVSFTLPQLTSFNNIYGDCNILMDPILSLVLGVTITDNYSLNAAIVAAGPASDPVDPALYNYLTKLRENIAKVLQDINRGNGGLSQVLTSTDNPYVTEVEYLITDFNDPVLPVVAHIGRAALVSKLVNSSSPISTENLYLLAYTGRRVVDRHGDLPSPCDGPLDRR